MLVVGCGVFIGLTNAAPADGDTRAISLYNINTKETLEVTYKKDGRHIPDAMDQINHFMRDWRADEATKMAPELIDLIWELRTELGSKKPVHLISGYRSRKTNNALRRKGGGQAANSRHIMGKAADIHFPDVSVKQLRNSALVREVGGVGYYPTSSIPFVHVDTDRVRHWPRLPRQELALLFPSGHTKHVPKDGQPITRTDYRIALANVRPGNPHHEPTGRPRAILASFTPDSLPSFFGRGRPSSSGEITGSIPYPSRRPAAKQIAAAPALRDGVSLRMTELSGPGDNALGDVLAYDPDHPDLLEYRPRSVLASLSAGHLIHPDQDHQGYWLMELKVRLTYSFAQQPTAPGRGQSTARFSGPAVRNLFAGTAPGRVADSDTAQPFRTALR